MLRTHSLEVEPVRYREWLYWTPRIVAILFAAFLSLFALDVVNEDPTQGSRFIALLMHLIPSLLVLIGLLIAWRRGRAGAAIFALLGIVYIAMAWGRFPILTFALISGPLFLLAILFLIDAHGRNNMEISD
jgi:hypothetical protein